MKVMRELGTAGLRGCDTDRQNLIRVMPAQGASAAGRLPQHGKGHTWKK